jgi:hypothetical protein
MASVPKTHPNQDFSDFWLEVSLKFSMDCFDLSSFFLLHKDENSTAANSRSSRISKMEPLSPITTELDFTYASDVAKNSSREPGPFEKFSQVLKLQIT